MFGRALRALSAAVLVLALAISVAQNRGLIEPRHLHHLHRLQGAALRQPAVAAAVDRLRAVPWLASLLAPVTEPGCSCQVGSGKPEALSALARRCTARQEASRRQPPA